MLINRLILEAIMKFASFDIETNKILPEEINDWKEYAPLGIACGALAISGYPKVYYWQNPKGLTKEECQVMVKNLQHISSNGYIPLTWNGAQFDFQVLAQESDMYDECAELALNHVDMMAIITFSKGWYVGLQKICEGTGIKGKLKEVKLNDGTLLTEMSGSKAPELWSKCEYSAVLEYLKDDVLQPLELAHHIEKHKKISWLSNSGKKQSLEIPKLLTVKECFKIPEVDNSWMENPPKRKDFIEWMPDKFKDFVKK